MKTKLVTTACLLAFTGAASAGGSGPPGNGVVCDEELTVGELIMTAGGRLGK